MKIEHSVTIHADLDRVWDIFTDLTCWKDWSSVLRNSSSTHDRLTEGRSFTLSIRPFSIPMQIMPVVEEVVPGKRIVWAGSKCGIQARHEFIFSAESGDVILTSREYFTLGFLRRILFHVPKRKLHQLSVQMLRELKTAAEAERKE